MSRFTLLAFLAMSCDTNSSTNELTTLILVRHAEKADDGTEDPPLSGRGSRRAQLLADWLSKTELSAIYSTSYQRNQSTVLPVAAQHNLRIRNYDAGEDATDFLNEVLKQYRGKQVLICGHSNTVPSMINALLGEDRYSDLPENAYGHVFVVTVGGLGQATVLDLHMIL